MRINARLQRLAAAMLPPSPVCVLVAPDDLEDVAFTAWMAREMAIRPVIATMVFIRVCDEGAGNGHTP